MNYYIEGNKANAAKIKAAFEKLGFAKISQCFEYDDYLYFSVGKRIWICKTDSIYANIIKTHPDYQELELPVEPKFKIGDWVVTDYGKVSQVVSVDNDGDGYTLDDGVYFSGSWCDMYHLWTIADAKDGDVLAADECYVIFKEIDGLNIKCYCTYHYMGFNPSFHIDTLQNKTAFKPATKEECDMLFAKIKDVGYQWYSDKKELKKIQPHYDIAKFYAGMPVLVRDDNNRKWCYLLYSHYDNTYGDGLCFNAGSVEWRQCIPFNEDTNHLLGTTDMCDEQYINW